MTLKATQLKQDPRIEQAKNLLTQALNEAQSEITEIKPPQKKLK